MTKKEVVKWSLEGRLLKLVSSEETWSYRLDAIFEDGETMTIVEAGAYVFSNKEDSKQHMTELAEDFAEWCKEKLPDDGISFEKSAQVRDGKYLH